MEQAMAGASPYPGDSVRPRSQLAARPQLRLSTIVADAFCVRPGELIGSTRGCARVALARQAAMYLARVSLGLTLSQSARLFARDRTTAAHACRVIEDRRDDPRFDAKLSAIEALLTDASR